MVTGRTDQQPYGRPLRLLAQYAEEPIRAALYLRGSAPTRLDELVEHRLEHLDNLQEVVEGVVADDRFSAEIRTVWRGHARRISELRPAWGKGMETFERFRPALRESRDVYTVGMEQAALAYPQEHAYQLWFFEGWLTESEAE